MNFFLYYFIYKIYFIYILYIKSVMINLVGNLGSDFVWTVGTCLIGMANCWAGVNRLGAPMGMGVGWGCQPYAVCAYGKQSGSAFRPQPVDPRLDSIAGAQ